MAQEGTSTFPGYPEVAAPAAADCVDPRDPFQWDVREDCEVRQILDRIADKWSLLVIALLDTKSMRFGELGREIHGVSKRMLTVTLRNLERDGLVHRTIYAEVPPRVEYRLTAMGSTLHRTVQTLVDWTEEHQEQIAYAREAFDRAQTAEVVPST
ncbi:MULTISPECIES: helix-turn-helix domain-containing protein [unclassified Microbacterium]|uniref:winged helix-turn-helix transcriptional regulator n=1 Tax=unclassified Microbacterium TaxID=2609290 RepID=UPI0012FCD1EF|nr:helix-turn-helix domain-containing protein [Microbacterium sp. MAH-37]MVQ44064.1 transcriptional regulator [Microbacterium sp. MAH-37]